MNVIVSIIVNIALILGIITGAGTIGVKSNLKFIRDEVKQVEYENQLIPTVDEDGTYKFTTDRDFRILHLTDIHIGAGSFSTSKDLKALNAVAAMVTEEKPDLVVVTGDVVYPVPLQAGTKDNEKSTRIVLLIFWYDNTASIKFLRNLSESMGFDRYRKTWIFIASSR